MSATPTCPTPSVDDRPQFSGHRQHGASGDRYRSPPRKSFGAAPESPRGPVRVPCGPAVSCASSRACRLFQDLRALQRRTRAGDRLSHARRPDRSRVDWSCDVRVRRDRTRRRRSLGATLSARARSVLRDAGSAGATHRSDGRRDPPRSRMDARARHIDRGAARRGIPHRHRTALRGARFQRSSFHSAHGSCRHGELSRAQARNREPRARAVAGASLQSMSCGAR